MGSGGAGNGDVAETFGNITGNLDGSGALTKNTNYAGMFGTETGDIDGAYSGTGNGNYAVADTNFSNVGGEVVAGDGNNNKLHVCRRPREQLRNRRRKYRWSRRQQRLLLRLDPFGSTPDSALAGSTATVAGSNDLAEVLFTHGNAVAQGGDFLYDIVSLFGNKAGTAAATSGSNLLSDMFGLF